MMALTIDTKLSSMRMISDVTLAASVPEIPTEKPTSAVLGAGPSFVKIAEDCPFHDDSARREDGAPQSDRPSCEDVVTSAHLDSNSSLKTHRYSVIHTFAKRDFDADNANEGEILGQILIRHLQRG